MIHALTLVTVLAACHATPPPAQPATAKLDAELVHSAMGSYGVQPAGEDKGTLYAFVRLQSDHAAHVSFTKVAVTRNGATCAQPTKPATIAKIDPITKQDVVHVMTLDALAKGTPFDGAVAAGTTFLRVQVEIDHACTGETEPTVELDLDNGTVITQPLAERMPS